MAVYAWLLRDGRISAIDDRGFVGVGESDAAT